MTTDATTQLIQRITNQLSPTDATAQTYTDTISLIGELVSSVGLAADFAQLLGTALLAGGTTEGIGFAAVLIFSAFLAVLGVIADATDSGSPEGQVLQELYAAILSIENIAITNYWTLKMATVQGLWSPLQVDLENIASEGFGQWKKGPSNLDVTENSNHFLGDAEQFVNLFIPTINVVDGASYWQRPQIPALQFSSQNVPYPAPGAVIPYSMGWYGNLPQPQSFASEGQALVPDPITMLPFLSLGITSYLMMIALLNQIDSSEPTFLQYLSNFKSVIAQYANQLYTQYQTAVSGILKCDIPSAEDVIGFLAYIELRYLGAFFLGLPPGSPMANPPNTPQAGNAWNGVYGVVHEYGFFQSPVEIPSSSPWHLLDIVDTTSLVGSAILSPAFEFTIAPPGTAFLLYAPYQYMWDYWLYEWVYPWIQDKLILGLMARWKAIYLFNGYDKVWSVLQKLGSLPGQSQPAALTLPDGTMANGNWSARELIDVLNLDADFFLPGGSLTTVADGVSGYSLFLLVQVLDSIATGSWVGPQGVILTSPLQGLSRPAGFRERLAAAAV